MVQLPQQQLLLFLRTPAFGYVYKGANRALKLAIPLDCADPVFDGEARPIKTKEQVSIDVRGSAALSNPIDRTLLFGIRRPIGMSVMNDIVQFLADCALLTLGEARVFPFSAVPLDAQQQVLGKKGAAFACKNGLMQGPKLRLDFGPHVAKGQAEGPGVLVAITKSGPHRTAMGKSEASMMLTSRERLGGQLSAGPSMVLDQSFARISADIFDAGGILGIECWVIGFFEAHASSNSQRPLAQCVRNLNWVVGFGKETAALWQILLR